MKEKLVEYLETELHYTKVGLEKEDDRIRRSDICWYAMQRGLGATQFAQMCGMAYSEVEPLFEDYKKKLEEMQYDL